MTISMNSFDVTFSFINLNRTWTAMKLVFFLFKHLHGAAFRFACSACQWTRSVFFGFLCVAKMGSMVVGRWAVEHNTAVQLFQQLSAMQVLCAKECAVISRKAISWGRQAGKLCPGCFYDVTASATTPLSMLITRLSSASQPESMGYQLFHAPLQRPWKSWTSIITRLLQRIHCFFFGHSLCSDDSMNLYLPYCRC